MTCDDSIRGTNIEYPDFVGGDSGDVFFLLALDQPTHLVISTCNKYTTFTTSLLLYDGAPTLPNSTLLAVRTVIFVIGSHTSRCVRHAHSGPELTIALLYLNYLPQTCPGE